MLGPRGGRGEEGKGQIREKEGGREGYRLTFALERREREGKGKRRGVRGGAPRIVTKEGFGCGRNKCFKLEGRKDSGTLGEAARQ